MGLVAPHVESSWTKDKTCVPCIGRKTPIQCSTREVQQHSCNYYINYCLALLLVAFLFKFVLHYLIDIWIKSFTVLDKAVVWHRVTFLFACPSKYDIFKMLGWQHTTHLTYFARKANILLIKNQWPWLISLMEASTRSVSLVHMIHKMFSFLSTIPSCPCTESSLPDENIVL